jgi:hypothetical protein
MASIVRKLREEQEQMTTPTPASTSAATVTATPAASSTPDQALPAPDPRIPDLNRPVAKVVRVQSGERFTTALIDIEGQRDGRRWFDRWQVILRQQEDINGRVAGYRVWLRRHDDLPRTREEALSGACTLIEDFTAAIAPPHWARPVTRGQETGDREQ